jgi:uncharacterized protein (DUF1684 family)
MISDVYVGQIEKWHKRRLSSLTNDYGWLTIVALEWLKEGRNVITDIGTITLQKGKASVQLSAGLAGKIGEHQFSSGTVRTEADPKGPDRVKVGSRSFTIIRRGERFALRMWDTNAEFRSRFSGINRFPIAEKWRLEAPWEEYKKPKVVRVASVVQGFFEEYRMPGAAIVNLAGVVTRLEPILEEGSQELCFAFTDGTTGEETYSGGRYLYAAPAEKGIVVLDFNKAINPPSAFTSFATNPLPPKSNHLSTRVEAGERTYLNR